MWLPWGEDFIDETLWIGTNNSKRCWIEVGDSEYNHPRTGRPKRNYYWAEYSKANGYQEHMLDQPAYPAVGAYQTYTIYAAPEGGGYDVAIGNTVVGHSIQPGGTIFVHVGLETTTPMAKIIGVVKFKDFEIYANGFQPWPNHKSSADFPAWWQWNWPTAVNGIPFPFFFASSE
jgi:hypothetical protein